MANIDNKTNGELGDELKKRTFLLKEATDKLKKAFLAMVEKQIELNNIKYGNND